MPVVDKEAADSLLELARREVKNAIAGTQSTGREDNQNCEWKILYYRENYNNYNNQLL